MITYSAKVRRKVKEIKKRNKNFKLEGLYDSSGIGEEDFMMIEVEKFFSEDFIKPESESIIYKNFDSFEDVEEKFNIELIINEIEPDIIDGVECKNFVFNFKNTHDYTVKLATAALLNDDLYELNKELINKYLEEGLLFDDIKYNIK